MFSKNTQKTFVDLSAELNDELDWEVGDLRVFEYHLNVTALAYEPVSGFLAVGTSKGIVTIYGSPGVEQRLKLTNEYRVRFLSFTTSSLGILCIDDHDRLHLWDLTNVGKPKLQTIVNYRQPVNCIALSPSHTHAFIALSTGEIKTFDLLCSRNSSYTIPNMWLEYEGKLASSGMPSIDTPGAELPVEVVIHPRDLNLVFVAYGGGVILSDLKQRTTLRSFELVLPPGAPGGAGYHSPDLMTHRRPPVTALAVHPAGHFFAVGHADGTIAFWALEDEDKPLLVRTLDEIDLHLVDAARLEEFFAAQESAPSTTKPNVPIPREPIFKLTWSGFPNSQDPRGGTTALTILGGLRAEDSPGVTVIQLPPFNPSEPPPSPSSTTEVSLHPSFRSAMKDSLSPNDAFTYLTKGVAEDFLLVPRDSPHFSGSWDPFAILLVSDFGGGTRAVEGYQFPPPSFSPGEPEAETASSIQNDPAESDSITDLDDVVSQELASTLESMKVDEDPKQLGLPFGLLNGPNGVTLGGIVTIPKYAYETLINGEAESHDSLQLKGGVAWAEDTGNEMKLLKHQPRRVLITGHKELAVRFHDISSQSLISSFESPVQTYFPNPLPSLTLDVIGVLAEPSVVSHTSPKYLQQARIAFVHLTIESLECAVIFRGGEIAVYKLSSTEIPSDPPISLVDAELIPLKHIPSDPGRRFHPQFLFTADRGPVAAFAISDIGFIAASYLDGSLFLVDMRGPRVMYRNLPDLKSGRKSFLHRNEIDPIEALTWTVSGTSSDPKPRVLLVATRASGSATIFNIQRPETGEWEVGDATEEAEGSPNPIPGGSVVIDARGTKYKADRNGLEAALSDGEVDRKRSIWISAGAKGVKCVADITGSKLGKTDWESKAGKVEQVVVAQKSTATVLVALTDSRQVLVYSLPYLELLHTLQQPQHSTESLTMDDTGDYIEWVRHGPSGIVSTARYGTLFRIRRSGPYQAPTIDFVPESDPRVIPPQPQPVSVGPASLLGSWLGYFNNQSMTGDQIDELLAGPDRPIPQPVVRDRDGKDTGGAGVGMTGIDARSLAANASNSASNLYNRLGNALSERGQMLGQLQESFDSLEQGSRRMLAQTKSLAAQQTAKRWFQW